MVKPQTYWILMVDANRDELEAVDDYELEDFDATALWTGDKLKDGIPDSVKIYLDDGLPSDNLGNPLDWLLFSHRFVHLIKPFCESEIELVPITLYRVGSNKPVNDYLLVNPLGCVDAISGKNKKAANIQHLTLKSKSIPPDKHFFRLLHQPTTIIFSQDVFDALKGKGLKGVAARSVTLN